MKKLIITLGLWLLVTGLWAQNDTGAKIVPVSQAIQKTVGANKYTIQVGIPYLGKKDGSSVRSTKPYDIRFPWDVLYLYKTFAKESFDISKGYFGDKVLISWTIRANIDLITNIKILRREYKDVYIPVVDDFIQIASVSKYNTEYEDKYVEGGVLYEYKVVAEGVGFTETLYDNYITGIGYRNPTATITGNVSYKGGNPVKDVTIKANSIGSSLKLGNALKIPAASKLEINDLNKPITTATTLQAWLKPVTAYTDDAGQPIRLFGLKDLLENAINVNVKLFKSSNYLRVNIGGSEFRLNNWYPSGNLDSRGDDILVPVTDFNTNFVHFSVVIADGEVPVLYINGRKINKAYQTEVNAKIKQYVGATADTLKLTIPTVTNDLTLGAEWRTIYIGGTNTAYVDEIRVWNAVKEPLKIRTDYRRYIGGNDVTLISYLRANEGVGAYAYDLSRTGFNYNKNHGKLWDSYTDTNKVLWTNVEGTAPTQDQLGILGVTDVNGNYEISAIPYSGTGESFNITPMYGQHQFEPNQQLVFLGQGSEVVNKIDFIDKSSFIFKGRVRFDTRGVFKSFVEVNSGSSITPVFTTLTDGDEYVNGPGILDEGYNYYQKGSTKYDKGEYWYNDNGTPDDDSDDYLERYAKIYSEGVNIYVDGNIILDENNIPVVSDDEGLFEISVPIGNHYISLKKNGHEFGYNGRFPAVEKTFKEFFEDSEEVVNFIDNTRVTLVGRVVGGSVESQKSIGFGESGLFTTADINSSGDPITSTVSSKNNIGVASITLGFTPKGASVGDYTRFNFTTDSATGEYRVQVMPLNYTIDQTTGLRIPKNVNINILSANESVNINKVIETTIPTYEKNDGTILEGDPYHYVKSFTYRSIPVVKVNEQTSDATIKINGVSYATEGMAYPIYTQFLKYQISLDRFERYMNYDTNVFGVESVVPIVDGELKVTNNLALANSSSLVVDELDASKITYSFKGGSPSISSPFTKTINIKYRINGIDYEAENYNPVGLILGGQSDGSQTFITAAPDVPDIILRDPPGSNSFASIEEGETITFTAESDLTIGGSVSANVNVELGATFTIGGGLAGPVIETEATASLDLGIGLSYSSTNGESLTKTYSFSQTISTSDDPGYVGSNGDLFIGNSKNYFYGSYDNVQSSKAKIGTSESLELTNSKGQSVFISKQKAMYFVEEPSKTFFIYSQKHILETLIPDLQLIISNLENGIIKETDPGVLTLGEYKQQVSLWKKTILENEKSKYIVKNNREYYRSKVANVIENFNDKVVEGINYSEDLVSTTLLEKKLALSQNLKLLLNDNFEDNISFDAGVGEFTRSTETAQVYSNTTAYNVNLNESVTAVLGFAVNNVGMSTTMSATAEQDINTALSEEEEETLAISYTLKDNDEANLLSVDVVNLFDGNGPIFTTIGGRTSCPYEGPEESKFFSEAKFKTYFDQFYPLTKSLEEVEKKLSVIEQKLLYPIFYLIITQYQFNALYTEQANLLIQETALNNQLKTLDQNFLIDINCCTDVKKAQFSYATQKVEVPAISVEVADISNVLEGRNAEFKLILENNSVSGTNASFLLIVDNLTNPNNALINIAPNGTVVQVPYGQKVYYTMTLGKSISDVYDYEDIRIVLQSLCDGENVSDDVTVSAHFIPACSEVVVSTPLDNWVYNRDIAYNFDGSTNPLMVKMIGFNTAFNSFQKIDLEYRLASSPTWSRLQTYYGSTEFFDAAVANNETEIALIESATLSFGWDIAKLKLQDGDYEIRARSSCTNDTEFISDIITGRVDLHAPQRFGTPLPIDGILGVGEDLKVSFNENIFYNPAVSNIEIKGQTNQLPIDHNVSLYFEGVGNTAVIENPKITSGNLTLEFWMNNNTQETATIISQASGLSIGLENDEIYFILGGVKAQGAIATDHLFHHYTFTYNNSTGKLNIYQDDKEIANVTGSPNLPFTNNNALVIGGNSFVGNMHDLRLWNKSISLENAYAKMYDKLNGNEASLIGYWPMTEGRGELAKDLARFKHAAVNAAWDIKPKGNSYDFSAGQYLALDKVGFVQLTNEMDATIDFWMKTGVSQEATIFSNGKGDGTDLVQSNGLTNKWAINITSSGNLTLESEGVSYQLTSQNMADNTWHHVTILFNRIGSLRTFVDAAPVSSNQMVNIGGFSGNKIWLGARGSTDSAGTETVDRKFTGKIDEFRLWNTLRNAEQFGRDRFNEVDAESIGLQLYARMNAPDPETGNGPRYYHASSGKSKIPDNAVLSSGTVSYSEDVPAIKPERNLIKFQVNHVINEDDMILEPVVNNWASLEGQIVDITVHRMFDNANNMQQSPITWTAYINRNEVSWFAEGYDEIVDIVKNTGEEKSFEITVINKGGQIQPYNISNVPKWLKLSKTSGTLQPDSKVTITATIDKELTAGEYLENLYLQTDFGFDEKLQVKIKVLADSPAWAVDPTKFDYSMNIVGRIKVEGKFSTDLYDKIAAFYEGKVRGVANLVYDESYQEYFAYLTVYSNNVYGENLEFSIWDASQGKILIATIDANPTTMFMENYVMGSLSNPVIFENSNVIVQEITMNKGWTWVSMNVTDVNFSNINNLTNSLILETNDRILSHSPAQLEAYFKDEYTPLNSGWSGSISANGGLSASKMYKVNLANQQTLKIKGTKVDISAWEFPIQTNWNWMPYPLGVNQSTNEALAYFDAVDGDVIKSQNLFAIYDPINGWKGTLNYLTAGKGYMIKSSKDQSFKYPSYLGKSSNAQTNAVDESIVDESQAKIAPEFIKYADNMNAVVLLPQGYHELFAYDLKGVLKGQSYNQTVGNTELSFITIYGDTPETLNFYIGDGFNKKPTTKTIGFKSNDVLGTIAKPIVLEEFLDNITVFPNPFENDLTIKVNALGSQIVTIQLHSVLGQLMFSKDIKVESGVNWLKITPNVTTGAYLLQVKMNENSVISKVIKK